MSDTRESRYSLNNSKPPAVVSPGTGGLGNFGATGSGQYTITTPPNTGGSTYIIPPAHFPSGGMVSPGTINNAHSQQPREWQLSSIAAIGQVIPLVYGQYQVSAKYFKPITHGSTIYLPILWALGPCVGVQAITDSNGVALTGVTMRHYDGSQTAPDARLKAAYEATRGGTFTATLARRCYSVFEIATNSTVSPDNFRAMIKGVRVYDPRDQAQDINNPTTWQWSDNAALCLADFISNTVYGWGKKIDWESVKDAADYCDELVGTTPNQFRRWTLNYAIIERQETLQLIELLRAYAHCFVKRRGDTIRLVPDKPRALDFALTEDQIIGTPQIIQVGIEQLPTVMVVSYTDSTGAQPQDMPAYQYLPGVREGLIRWSESNPRMPGISTSQEATREATERLNKLQYSTLKLTADVRDIGIELEVGDLVSLPHPTYPGGKWYYLTANPALIGLGKYRLDAMEYQPEFYVDDVTLPPTYPDTTLPDPSNPLPVENLAVVERLTQIGGAWTSALYVTWSRPEWAYNLEYVVELSQDGVVIDTSTVPIESYISDAVADGKEYIVRVRTKSWTYLSAWVTVSITALGKHLPPSNVERFTEAIDINGTVHLAWQPAHDIDAITYELRRIIDPGIDIDIATPDALNALWASADVVASPSDTRVALPLQPPAAYIYLVNALDSVGNYSLNPAAVSLTVELDDNARFVDTFSMAITQTINASAWMILADPAMRWTSDRGESINFGHSDPDATTSTFSDLADTLFALPHDQSVSELVSQIYDVGAVVGGTWSASVAVIDHDGAATLSIELSNNASTWESFPGSATDATASRPARFARLRIASDGSYTLTGAPTLSLAAIPRVETGEILVGDTGTYSVRTVGRYKGYLGDNPIDLEYLGTDNYTPARDSIMINQDGTVRFDVYLRDQYGARATGRVKWTFRGV